MVKKCQIKFIGAAIKHVTSDLSSVGIEGRKNCLCSMETKRSSC